MTEPITNPSDGGAPKGTPQVKTVPEEVHVKVLGEKESEISKLKGSLDDAQEKLLSPDYLEFLASKISRTTPRNPGQPGSEAIPEAVNARLGQLEGAIRSMAAVLELTRVEKDHPDFNEYAEDVQNLVKAPGSSLSFEEAYLVAKGKRPPPAPAPATPPVPKKGSEKPTGTQPPPEGVSRKFKTEYEAASSAAAEVLTKHGLSGDII